MELKKAWEIFKKDFKNETGLDRKFYMTKAQMKNRTATVFVGSTEHSNPERHQMYMEAIKNSEALKTFEENAGVKVRLSFESKVECKVTCTYIRFSY